MIGEIEGVPVTPLQDVLAFTLRTKDGEVNQEETKQKLCLFMPLKQLTQE